MQHFVVEDEFMLADVLLEELTEAGALVIGPAQTIADAFTLLETADLLDAAVLDINVRGEQVYPIADVLAERRVPFVFTTGYDASIPPAPFSGSGYLGKPVDHDRLVNMLQSMIESPVSSSNSCRNAGRVRMRACVLKTAIALSAPSIRIPAYRDAECALPATLQNWPEDARLPLHSYRVHNDGPLPRDVPLAQCDMFMGLL